MKVQKISYYGFNHDMVSRVFEGDPIFTNEFTIRNEYWPVAVYYVRAPNRLKGHKEFLLLSQEVKSQKLLVRGVDKEEIEDERYQRAIHCNGCNEVIYSVMRHDLHTCSCGAFYIDGGKDFWRYGANGVLPLSEAKEVVLDLLTDQLVDRKIGVKPEIEPRKEIRVTETATIILPTKDEVKKLGKSLEDLEVVYKLPWED